MLLLALLACGNCSEDVRCEGGSEDGSGCNRPAALQPLPLPQVAWHMAVDRAAAQIAMDRATAQIAMDLFAAQNIVARTVPGAGPWIRAWQLRTHVRTETTSSSSTSSSTDDMVFGQFCVHKGPIDVRGSCYMMYLPAKVLGDAIQSV